MYFSLISLVRCATNLLNWASCSSCNTTRKRSKVKEEEKCGTSVSSGCGSGTGEGCVMVLETAGSSSRPVLTFNPNWDKIFTTESLTMTCNLRIRNINLEKSSQYKCRKQINSLTWNEYSRETSISIKELFTLPEIKVTPFPITEGDNVTVTCHTNVSPYRPDTELQFVFYRDNQIIQRFSSSHQYGVQSAQLEDSGTYYCDVTTISGKILKRSKELNVKKNELFTPPEIKVTPFPVTEGDNVTVTCHTNVSPYRPDTELQFVFYRDGQIVQRFSSSDQYGVQSAQLEDSGKYYCEVRTISGKIVKRSKELNIKINEFFIDPEIIMSTNQIKEMDTMTLSCHTKRSPHIPSTDLQFAFYRDGWNVQRYGLSDQYWVQSAKLQDSGNYSCDVRSSTKSITKSSKIIYIRVQELFSQPEIEMIPDLVEEGNQMILICNTTVLTMRNDLDLQFAFYKNGQNIQGFNSSHQYEVTSAEIKDSGNYSCEVRTSTV
ncbi:Fc receptor-like protein 2 [Pyxicephalus adspersus]|uniref:Fc receptor-like protein 2 n=1 Tax=Pyxicephalus adspersus TaxID=30357 RepID=UPI003B5BF478